MNLQRRIAASIKLLTANGYAVTKPAVQHPPTAGPQTASLATPATQGK